MHYLCYLNASFAPDLYIDLTLKSLAADAQEWVSNQKTFALASIEWNTVCVTSAILSGVTGTLTLLVIIETDNQIVMFIPASVICWICWLPLFRHTAPLPSGPASTVSQVLIGYYSWGVTNQIAPWAGHWGSLQSSEYREAARQLYQSQPK